MKQKHIKISLAIFLIACLGIGVIGNFWTNESVSTWYPTLEKPSGTPPDWVFGPVWTLLYTMIAISGWLIYTSKKSHQRSCALRFYTVQLILNLIWSFLFFFLQSPFLGLIDIIMLCLFIFLTILKSWPLSRLASLLLIPYFIWVLYATFLNTGIWLLNTSI